ncbi:uncharacterized protein LOC128669850 [Plodia interpunctella]|uniref:uncharacterized protein LOC128669850 n=1 Tax=Plodia interpunctella TaxID=58824 RepID=UPI002368D74C|nr:uncharacterized protein LOC128669850 [Plodia interpunctella]
MLYSWILLSLLALGSQGHATDERSDFCDADGGTWSCLLNEWAVTASASNDTHCRRGRVMSLPPTKGYYVTDRMDPPPHHPHGAHSHHLHPHAPPKAAYYEEWQASPPPPGAGKIVNRPPNPYKDQFRPSYPAPSPNQPIPLPPQYPRPAADRVDEPPPPPPPKRVTETDLYLLTAIEKLVFRVDLMEKRLRKLEESVHYLVAGKEPQPEPCPEEFIRVGSTCYHFSSESLDWKSANLRCRKLSGHLLEFRSTDQRRQMHSALLADKRRRGDDWWTGGLNPGLLWIWSHSARPVLNDTSSNSTATQSANSIAGDGRCLALVHNPGVSAYVYRGQDCAMRIRYICERGDDAARLSNEIEKTAKQLEDTSNVLKKVQTTKLAADKTEKVQKTEKPAEKADNQLNVQAL